MSQKIVIWTYIDPNDNVPLPRKTVLCTNNIEATYNSGVMSQSYKTNIGFITSRLVSSKERSY